VRLVLIPVALLIACGPQDSAPSASRGGTVYRANCIACHSLDPRHDGVLGPAVAGSPRALIEARVLRAEYPPGYTPKRETRQMVPLPFLEQYVDDLALYLANPK
jgi:mono/diheme cytochrome c family protein